MIQLGTVTYNIAKDWDLPTLLQKLEKLKYAGVELRTTHKHGVEPSLSAAQRAEVKKRFEDSPVEVVGLGSTCEFHSNQPDVVKKQIEECKAFVRLAHDIGAKGVKVRPNGVPRGENPEITFERIGKALAVVGADAEDFGVEIRVEVHGAVTSELSNIAKILKHADQSNVFVCWNSNPGETRKGSIKENFDLVADKIRLVHLRDLFDEAYPWKELFQLLKTKGYNGYTLAEIPESSDPERVMRYFRSLWLAYQPT